MSDSSLRVLLAIVLMFHGIGHGLGILSTMGVKLTGTQSSSSAILGKFIDDKPVKIIAFCLWAVVLICFVIAGLGILGIDLPKMEWQPIAIFASLLSLLGLVLYWNAFPLLFPHKMGAIAVDVGVLICLIWLKWPAGLVK